jgi:hypothetical protein
MNLAVLAIVLVFMIYLRIGIKWSDKTFKKTQEGYRQREEDANFTRRKSLDDLDYVTIPENVAGLIKRFNKSDLTALLDENTKIVNLNGISNTDLKLKYGAPNINILSEYDKNFETLVKGLQDMVSEETGDMFNTDEKISILEFATDIHTDISASFEMLARIYKDTGREAKIHSLIKKAESIKNIRGPRIIEKLNKILEE